MDLGDLELRGILARKSKLFLWLDCSRAWPHLRRSQINAGEKRKYRAPNIGSSDLGSCFYWNCRSRDDFRTRIRARAGLASDYRYLGDRLRSHYAYASRLLVGGRQKFAARGIVPDFVFPYCCSLAASFRAANNGGLMQAVAAATAGLLHWFGIPAQTAGGAITLRTGVVGITEACSGMRSLQAGIMFGLAMGEWFLLRPQRRIVLLLIAIALALCTNLVRTLVLSLQAEWNGLSAVEKIHDFTGTLAVSALVFSIWIFARALRQHSDRFEQFRFEKLNTHLRALAEAIPSVLARPASALLIAGIFGIGIAQIVSATIEAQDRTQTTPFFSVREDPSQTRVRLPRDVWNELHPTSGEYIRVRNSRLGAGEVFHFFWKPSPWNRFVLVHRPDICMPGVGWESSGSPESITIDFSGHQTQLYLFRFRRGDTEALELWGVWRNGDAVSARISAQSSSGGRGCATSPASRRQTPFRHRDRSVRHRRKS